MDDNKQNQAVSNVFAVLHAFLRKADAPFRLAADCMLGKKHPHARFARLLIGALFMGVGVFLSHVASVYEWGHAGEMMADALGYALHGMGLTPWLEVITDALDDGKLDEA